MLPQIVIFDDEMMVKEIQEKYWDQSNPDLRVYYQVVNVMNPTEASQEENLVGS